MSQSKVPSKTTIIIRSVLAILLLFILIFVPAGTFKWPEAWIYLGLYFAAVTSMLVWMKKKAPGLLKERMAKKKDAKTWDKIIISVYSFILVVLLVVPGLDAVRFGWSKVPLILKALAFIGYIPAVGFAFWAMKENAYLSDVVRIQKDRGHTVCTTGPYRYIRHPMYVGIILVMICFPLSLGSLYSYIPAFMITVLFVIRTALEDKSLKEELPGYREYTEKVRYRLIPGIW